VDKEVAAYIAALQVHFGYDLHELGVHTIASASSGPFGVGGNSKMVSETSPV